MERRGRVLAAAAVAAICAALGGCSAVAKKGERLVPWYMAVADAPMPLADVTNVVEDVEGNVWFGGAGGLVRFSPGTNRWRVLTHADGLAEDDVRSLGAESSGVVWVCGQTLISRYDIHTGRWSTLKPPFNFPVIATAKGQGAYFHSWDSARLYRYDAAHGTFADLNFKLTQGARFGGDSVSVSPLDGTVWLLPSLGQSLRSSKKPEASPLVRYAPNTREFSTVPVAGLAEAGVFGLFASADGTVWVYGNRVVLHLNPARGDTERFDSIGDTERFDSNTDATLSTRLWEDPHRDIWMSNGSALYRLDRNVKRWVLEPGMPRTPYFLDVAAGSDGRFWIPMPDEVAVFDPRARESRWTAHTAVRSLPGPNLSGLGYATGPGERFTWASTSYITKVAMAVLGTFRMVPDHGQWLRASPSADAKTLAIGSRGSVTTTDNFGFRSITVTLPDKTELEFGLDQQDVAAALADDERRVLWLAGTGGSLTSCGLRDPKSCAPSSLLRPLGVRSVDNILARTPHTIWFSTDKGLIRYRPSADSGGQFAAFESLRRVTDLEEDDPDATWVASEKGLFRVDPGGIERIAVKLDQVTSIRKDHSGNLWVSDGSGAFVRYGIESKRAQAIQMPVTRLHPRFDPSGGFSAGGDHAPFADGNGDVWYASGDTILRQAWLPYGTPKRPVAYPTIGAQPKLSAVASAGRNTYRWETRPTGLMRTGPTGAIAFPYKYEARGVLALAGAPGGGAWLAQAESGLAFHTLDGQRTEIGMSDGLPDSTVRDISPVPEAKTPLAWVATDGGAALVTERGVTRQVTGTPGPVDAIAAYRDGSAWMAFNPIDAKLFLEPDRSGTRSAAFLQQVKPNGSLGPRVDVPRGEVLSLAADPDGANLWVGTSAGLFRLKTSASVLERVTAKGRLQPSPIQHLTVDLSGTVWMAISSQGADTSASVLGYDPSADDIQAFTDERGLPKANSISSLYTTRDGDLVVEAEGRIVKGRVFVPPGLGPTTLGLIAGLTLLSGAAGNQLVRARRLRQVEMAAHRPLLDLAQTFFATAGFPSTRTDHRTLLLDPDPSGQRTAVLCALGNLLPVEKVIEAYERLRAEGGSENWRAYLAYPREMDPAATRQLDVYRLRQGSVIVPISGTFMRAKLEEGEDRPRMALDGLTRRYMGEQDLFNARNAIDEPRFFFGRRALLGELEQALNRREHVALIGPRKAGKSSVLNLLQQRLESFPVAKVDLQIYQRDDASWPHRLMARIIESYDGWARIRYGDKWKPAGIPGETITGTAFQQALVQRKQLQLSAGATYQPLVILLDEIERVFPTMDNPDSEAARTRGERYIVAAGILRALGQEGGERLISIVIADLHLDFNRVNAFGIRGLDTNPFYRFFQERFITPLNGEECTEMLTEIAHAMGLTLETEVLDRIFADSGGHVALARQLASAACRKRGGSQAVSMAHYQEALIGLREESGDLDSYFSQNFWNVSTTEERAILLRGVSEPGVTDEEFQAGSGDGERASAVLEARRQFLVTGILERIGKQRYRVNGNLFREWLMEKSELGKGAPE